MYAPEEDPKTPASCPSCRWAGKAGDGVIDMDQTRRCPRCLCLLERIDPDPPTVVESEEYFRPMI